MMGPKISDTPYKLQKSEHDPVAKVDKSSPPKSQPQMTKSTKKANPVVESEEIAETTLSLSNAKKRRLRRIRGATIACQKSTAYSLCQPKALCSIALPGLFITDNACVSQSAAFSSINSTFSSIRRYIPHLSYFLASYRGSVIDPMPRSEDEGEHWRKKRGRKKKDKSRSPAPGATAAAQQETPRLPLAPRPP